MYDEKRAYRNVTLSAFRSFECLFLFSIFALVKAWVLIFPDEYLT